MTTLLSRHARARRRSPERPLRETRSARELERRGLVILRLRVADEFTKLGGRPMLALAPIGGGGAAGGEISSR